MMEASLAEKSYSKPLVTGVSIAVLAILIGAVPLLYNPYVTEPVSWFWLEDPDGDVEIIGEQYPGIVDLTYVRLDVDEGLLKLRMTVKDSIPEHLDVGEYAQWMATVILLDGLPRTYEVCVEMNSTVSQGEMVGYFREVGTQEAEPCMVERDGNSLSVSARLDGLQSSKEIQWSISATWEKWSGSELVSSGFDCAPDEGFQTMVLEEA